MTEQNTEGNYLWSILWKATTTLEEHALRSARKAGICHSDFAVLELLLHKGSQPVNAIGQKIFLTSGSITTAIDRLERRGFVRRQWEHEDRRVCLVVLTVAGRRLIEKASDDNAATMERAAGSLTLDERAVLLTLLKKLGLGAKALLDESGNSGLTKKRSWKNSVEGPDEIRQPETRDSSIVQEAAVGQVETNASGFDGFTGLD